ncbi:sulfatase [Singulisphaera sp. Ch08]|uniref:Sulfatase n=1 Tax=Singulisphaera sp. Ch08 TaxID=3120278 RepID=A0AAU7CL95_9BACT
MRIHRSGSITRFLAGWALVLFAGPTSWADAQPPKQGSKPNVLFIAVDDLRPEFGAYGHPEVKSPNLDRLAARGLTFQRAYCQQAVCSPSRTSLLTGARPDTTKVYDLVTHFRKAMPETVTLPQFFKAQGYFVQGLGKIYHPGFNDPPSWSVPWETATPQARPYALAESRALAQKNRQATAPAKAKAKKKAAAKQGSRGPAFESADVPDDAYLDGAVANMAVKTLQSLKAKEEPFFLAVGFAKPHLPFVAPKRYWDLYDPAKIALASNPYRPKGAPEYAVQPGGELRSYANIPTGHVPDELARTLKHGYYAAISFMDAQVGKLLDELDRLSLRDNTIIVLWGDHGWKLGEHDAWCKHSNVELDTHVPLIVVAPGQAEPGKQSKALVEFVDLYPSLAELAGLTPPAHVEGTSFLPVLKSPDRPWKSAAFSQYPRQVEGRSLMGYSMRTDRYRFTRWVERDDPTKVTAVELYDHETDPQENQNIADDPANTALVAKLTKQWQAGWQGTKAELSASRP